VIEPRPPRTDAKPDPVSMATGFEGSVWESTKPSGGHKPYRSRALRCLLQDMDARSK
jgi:hypothetical protein